MSCASNTTKTVPCYTYPYECVHGMAPVLEWLQIWGCTSYALKPLADWRSILTTRLIYFFPALDNIIVSVHVVFNEIILAPISEYCAEWCLNPMIDRLSVSRRYPSSGRGR